MKEKLDLDNMEHSYMEILLENVFRSKFSGNKKKLLLIQPDGLFIMKTYTC